MNSDNPCYIGTTLRTPVSFFLCFCLLSASFLIPAPNTAKAEETPVTTQQSQQQILIPPFEIQTQEPHPHLQTGLANILATRVTKSTGHTIVQHSDMVDNLTELLHQQNNVAVQNALQKIPNTSLLAGTLKEQEEGYEINIKVFGHRPSTQISLTQSFNQLESALTVLDELSLDIAEKIFSIARPKKTEIAEKKDGLEGFYTAHPERMFKEKKYNVKQEITQNTEPEIKSSGFGIQSSRQDPLPSSTVLAMAVGDLNNDGTKEFVSLEKASVVIYHKSPNASFQRIALQPLARHLGLHTINLADLDHNGLQEIYIGASNGKNPASQILEWDGRNFHVLYQNASYYLRPEVGTAGQTILLGQENVFQEGGSSNFYSLKRQQDGSLMKRERLTLPLGFNIYDFILVDLDMDGTLEFVGITRGNKLTVIDKSGRTLWKSEKSFGASREILGTLSSTVDGDRNQANNPKPLYMHTRLIAQDLNGDGKPEIILGRNRLTDTTFFRRLRSFEGSSITALTWSDGTMKTMWESPKFSGYTVDFHISKGTAGTFRLVAIEQEHSNNLVSFLSRKDARVHTVILGRNDAVAP